MTLKFVVDGEPFGKKRPRFRVIKGQYVQTYNPKENELHERFIQMEYMEQCHGRKFPDGSHLFIQIDCFMEAPRTVSKAKRVGMLTHQIRPTKKPDWDNIGKTVCDSLNGIAYRDDSMVVEGRVRKFYSEMPRMHIVISDSEEEFESIVGPGAIT